MPTKHFEVLEDFDPIKHDNGKITPNIKNCLTLFKKGITISPKKFATDNNRVLNTKNSKITATLYTVDRSIQIAKELGLIELVNDKPISYADFLNLDSIQYFTGQLRGSKLKNLETDGMKDNTTKRSYVQQVYAFNNWLHGKTFEFSTTKQVDIDTFKKTKESVTLDGIEHLLTLFQNSYNTESEYIKVIKMYLMDPINAKCSAKYMSVKHSAITSYFEKNDSPLKFKYNSSNNHANYKEENENATITLEEVYKMITLGRASPLEKAVVLCRFHRGLDSSTLADRFNFQVWEQLTKWFGHSDFENWDLQKCPVPIRLSRVKTNYNHTGYLDNDAVVAIQDYLNFRYQLYVRMCKKKKIDEGYILEKNQLMQNGKPLFVNRENQPISVNWVSRLVPRLATSAGIQKNLKGNRLQNKSEKIGHELRDLLKSTLIVSGTSDYVCQLAIGHKIGDSYEKQDKLYPDKSREEYAKASKKLNIFSNVSNFMNGADEIKQLKEQIVTLESNYNSQLQNEIKNAIREEREYMIEEVPKQIRKHYDEKIKQNHIDYLNAEKGYKREVEIIENDAGEKYQQEKELMHQLRELGEKSGKSSIEIMAELLKTHSKTHYSSTKQI